MSIDEDEDLALPNDAEDMHKMLRIRKEELKQVKQHKTQLIKQQNTGILINSDNSSRKIIDARQSNSSLSDLLSARQPPLESINNVESSYQDSEIKKREADHPIQPHPPTLTKLGN